MWRLISVCLLLTLVHAQDWELVWQDEFDGDSIDLSKWQHEVTAWGGGNGEFQTYTPDPINSFVRDGKLFIRATPFADITNPQTGEPYGEDFLTNGVLDLNELYGECHVPDNSGCYRTGGDIPPIASARLRTAGRFSYRYGRAIMSAKMPVGDWLWPALWMLPESWLYGPWPLSGEIDIIEAIGNRNYRCDGLLRGIQHMGSTLHWGIDFTENKYYLTHGNRNDDDRNYGDYFHTYRLDWSPQGFEWFVDDELLLSVPDPLIHDRNPSNCFTGFYDFGAPWGGGADPWTNDLTCDHFMAPFDQEFHFLFNVAVGGTNNFIPDGCENWDGEPGREKPWANGQSQREGMWQFYNARSSWEDTWINEGDDNAMQVDYIRVYQPVGGFPHTQVPEGCPTPPGPNNCP